jgi:hypothetical protein
MHEASINFLDHSPGNTLIVKKSEGKYDFYLVDLNRMNLKIYPLKHEWIILRKCGCLKQW